MLPPSPRSSPVVNLSRFVRDPYAVFWKAAEECGPVFTFEMAGQPPWVCLGEPELIEAVFRGSPDDFEGASEVMKSILPPGALVLLEGDAHRDVRGVLRPFFSRARVERHAETIARATDAALDGLRPGQVIRLTDLFSRITLRTMVECVFGIRDALDRDEFLTLLEDALARQRALVWPIATLLFGGDRVARFTEWAVRTWPHAPFGFARTKRKLGARMQLEIERCRAHDDGTRQDVLAELATEAPRRWSNHGPAGEANLEAQLWSVLVGGHDTSAITSAWATWFLLRDPRALAELRNELRAANSTAYLTCVVEETMRLRPIAHHTARRLARPLRLGRWDLPAGTYTLPSQAVTHFRADLWDRPLEFRPQRFRDRKPSPFHYFPFGGGARTCLGRAFAMMQMRVMLARTIDRLDVQLVAGSDPKPAMCGLLIGPSDGIRVQVLRVRPPARVESTLFTECEHRGR